MGRAEGLKLRRPSNMSNPKFLRRHGRRVPSKNCMSRWMTVYNGAIV